MKTIAEFLGPVTPFLTGSVPKQLVEAVSSRQSTQSFLLHAFRLLSRLTNNQSIRIPLIENIDFLTILVRSFSSSDLRQAAIICSSNIAMDPSHRGKIALLNADILLSISAFLESTDPLIRYAILSLIALLAVPKDGKHKISTDRDLPDLINRIAKDDDDESCREAASEVRVLVSELPLGKAILGGQKVDPKAFEQAD
ncbi:hypothetical protein TRFO_24142 [Tritrichomonas foetus]|uniref:Uncharacterized protein n=1 Tax=Tritrichomonas foetus TaxID=1144522 RepID=A0A1J4K8V2_9EUKA|nr:hypothetical protein TRFO_24142 [Tritrichomonas foetus]|eukprot:OHT07643.1 hypothetical protein TRFO_24142 [Tritrichomonas foetus]